MNDLTMPTSDHATASDAISSVAPPTRAASDAAHGNMLKVLVIDDAPDVRIYVRALLRKWGYDTVLASNGAEGLERMRQGGIRLVVCDWMMDGMSGPEVCAGCHSSV